MPRYEYRPETRDVYPPARAEMNARRMALAAKAHDAFTAFGKQVFAEGALPEVTKQQLPVAIAHTTWRKGASDEQIMSAAIGHPVTHGS